MLNIIVHKKWFSKICLILLPLLFSSCAISSEKSLVTISNHTDKTISMNLFQNVSNIAPGASQDYWLSSETSFTATSSDIKKFYIAKKYDEENGMIDYSEETKCYFKFGYRYEIRCIQITVDVGAYIINNESLILAFIEPGIKIGEKKESNDFYHYPATYY